MSRREEAMAAFKEWLTHQGGPAGTTFEERDWAVSPYREAFVIVPGGRLRANTLYVVLGSQVRAISPATESLDEAYDALAGQQP